MVNDKEYKIVRGYIREIADAIELRDWTIDLSREYCDDWLEGNANCVNGQKYITIKLGKGFITNTPQEQRETIVHELIHAHTEVMWKMIQTDLDEALGKPTYYLFTDSFRRAMEYCVDSLAKALSKHLPIINWDMKVDKKKSA